MENGEQHSGRFAIIPSVALDDPRVTPALLRLLCVLGSYGNKQGYCKVKLTTLAARVNPDGQPVGKPAISNGLKKLKDYGYIEIVPRYAKEGGQLANMYRILFDQPLKDGEEMNGDSPPEVNPYSPPEVNPYSPPEVNPLNDLFERSNLTLPAAAAISLPTGEEVNEVNDDAAAAAWNENVLRQTAEQIRQRLNMPLRNLDGLMDILRQYPEASQYFIAQAAACADKLRKRPLHLSHFQSWLERSEIARTRAVEQGENTHDTAHENRPSDEDKRRAAKADEERRRRLDEGVAAILEKYNRPATG